jgi:hypothetical protein
MVTFFRGLKHCLDDFHGIDCLFVGTGNNSLQIGEGVELHFRFDHNCSRCRELYYIWFCPSPFLFGLIRNMLVCGGGLAAVLLPSRNFGLQLLVLVPE